MCDWPPWIFCGQLPHNMVENCNFHPISSLLWNFTGCGTFAIFIDKEMIEPIQSSFVPFFYILFCSKLKIPILHANLLILFQKYNLFWNNIRKWLAHLVRERLFLAYKEFLTMIFSLITCTHMLSLSLSNA